MNTRSKIFAAAIGLLVATGAVADASAATQITTKHVTRTIRPIAAKKTVMVVARHHRAHFANLRILPGHRLAPRVKIVTSKRLVGTQRSAMAHRVNKTIVR